MAIENDVKQPLVNNRFFKGLPQDVLRSSAPTMRAVVVLWDKDQEKQDKERDGVSHTPGM